jgi:energy-coupling factor transporter ATP-binding protein EcfA2
MSTFKKAERRGAFIKLAITGPSGSGKTTGAILMARGLAGPQGKIAVIDTENRSASLYSDIDDFDVLDIEPPYEQSKFAAAVKAAVDAKYDVLVIDSFSHVWEAILSYKDQLDKRGGNSFTNWNAAGEKFKDVLGAILSAKLHVIACMRAKMEFVIEENAGRKTVRKVGLAPIMRDGIEFEFTTVFDLDMSHQAMSSKDRTRMFDGKVFKLGRETGDQISSWLKGAKAEDLQPAPAPIAAPAPETVAYYQAIPITADQLAKLSQYNAVTLCAAIINKALDHYGEASIDLLTEEQAEKIISRCQDEMNKPSEKPTPKPATSDSTTFPWPASIAAWLKSNEAAVNAYLVSVKLLQAGQTFRQLDGQVAEKIITRPANFARAAHIEAMKEAA